MTGREGSNIYISMPLYSHNLKVYSALLSLIITKRINKLIVGNKRSYHLYPKIGDSLSRGSGCVG